MWEGNTLQCHVTVCISQDPALRLERGKTKDGKVEDYRKKGTDKGMHGEIIHCTCSDNVSKPDTGFPGQDDTCMNEADAAGCEMQSHFHMTHTHKHTHARTHAHMIAQRGGRACVVTQWNSCSDFVQIHLESETEMMCRKWCNYFNQLQVQSAKCETISVFT